MIHYDVVVIGSGFGGAITALRLAEAGQSVLILERGKHYKPEDFPRDIKKTDELLWTYPKKKTMQGLYDVRFHSDIATISASGVGGGSLIYANIHYRPQAKIFDDARWPDEINLNSLETYYQRVADKLDLSPLPKNIPLRKRDVFIDAANKMNRPVFDVPMAVAWSGNPGEGRQACQMATECEFGCRYGAKNSLDFNYLAHAQQLGAKIQARCLVSHIAKEESGYKVFYEDTKNGTDHHVTGKRVIVAAGTLGTNEILLRSRDHTKTLPELSQTLGHSYSGNGDFVGSLQKAKMDLEPWKGPDVTSAMWFYDKTPGFVLTAVTYNKAVMEVLASFGQVPPSKIAKFFAPTLWKLLPIVLPFLLKKGMLSKPLNFSLEGAGSPERMMNLFSIGQDNANGRITLVGNKLNIKWNYTDENKTLIARQQEAMKELAEKLGGNYAPHPIWNLFGRMLSVHHLGGCAISSGIDKGVVDINGQVHRYPGLFVADGSIIPTAIGSHPVMTISALAEWIAERIVAKV